MGRRSILTGTPSNTSPFEGSYGHLQEEGGVVEGLKLGTVPTTLHTAVPLSAAFLFRKRRSRRVIFELLHSFWGTIILSLPDTLGTSQNA